VRSDGREQTDLLSLEEELLEEENRWFKQLVADLSLVKLTLQDCYKKNCRA
jgi:hypothetical protein